MKEYRNQIRQTEDQIQDLEDQLGTLNKEEIQKLKQQKRKDLESEHQNKKKQLLQIQKAAKQAEKIQEDINKLTIKSSTINRNINELNEKIDSTKPLNELKQQKQEIERLNKEDRAVINNEDISPSAREAAEARVAAREKELRRVNTQIAEREESEPLRERIKEIFKKYGFTVIAVGIAISTTLGVLISKLTSGINAVGKKVGNDIKELGEKIKSILPGLLGEIMKLVFNTAGKVIFFLGEHARLLISAVAAFLIEKTIKRKS